TLHPLPRSGGSHRNRPNAQPRTPGPKRVGRPATGRRGNESYDRASSQGPDRPSLPGLELPILVHVPLRTPLILTRCPFAVTEIEHRVAVDGDQPLAEAAEKQPGR